MAHFAKLDGDNKVLQIVVIDNDEIKDGDGNESEAIGITACQTYFDGGTWIQTSYNNNMRGLYAGVGYTYDTSRDIFIPPQEFPSWSFNVATFLWEAPVALPADEGWNSDMTQFVFYEWDEDLQQWGNRKAVDVPAS